MYTALLADMKQSTSYKNSERWQMQNAIEHSLYSLNNMYYPGFIKRVDFSGGDGVQGLFKDPISAYLYFRLFSLALGVGKFRCGIGIGAWETRLDSRDDSDAQDGEAYHLARHSIDDAKKGTYYDLICRCRNEKWDFYTVLLDHSWGICKMRTDSQNEVAFVAELLYPLIPEYQLRAWDEKEWIGNAAELLSVYVNLKGREKRSLLSEGVLKKMAQRDMEVTPTPITCNTSLTSGRHDSLYGSARDIASAAGVAFQGVSRKISQGRIIQERNAITNIQLCWDFGIGR